MTAGRIPTSRNFYDRFFQTEDPNNVLVDQISSSEYIIGRARAGAKETDFIWQLAKVFVYGEQEQVVYAADGEPRFRWVDRELVFSDTPLPEDGSPGGIAITQDYVDANSPAGTLVGLLLPLALDVGLVSYAFEITNDPSNKFEIDPLGSNQLYLTDTALGVDGSYDVEVRVVDSQGRDFTQLLTINVASIRLSSDNVNEGVSIGTKVADIIATEGTLPISFSIINDPDNKFQISGSDLQTADTIDFTESESHEVTIQSTDASLSTRQETFTIKVNAASQSLLSSVIREDKEGNDALRTYPVNNVGPFGQFDEIQATYPTTSSEQYEYLLNGTSLGTVTVTYLSPSKVNLSSVVYAGV
jgi:hypothetical protein